MVSLLRTIQDHQDEINCCAFSPALLATCSGDKTIRLYDTSDFSELPFSPLSGHGYGVHCCRFSACGAHLITCSTDGSCMVWSALTGEVEATLKHPERSPVRVCALSPDSSLLLTGAADGTVALWDFHLKKLLRCAAVSEATVMACCFSPCGQTFATGCSHGNVKLWDADFRPLHAEKDAHDLGVACCQFAPQYKIEGGGVRVRLASCGQDSLLKMWSVSLRPGGGADCEMQLLYILTGQSAPVLSCAFSSDGELLVSGSVDKTVTVYDANRGVLLHTLDRHQRYVTAVALSPTMPLMATGSMDKTVNVWTIEDEDGSQAEAQKPPCRGSKTLGRARTLVSDWSEADVSSWLGEEGLEELVGVFKDNNIDGAELIRLDQDTLTTELGVDSVGLRRRLLRKAGELKAALNGSDAPDEFQCPITREVMRDPVIAADGYSYEREAIESWISARNRSSPMTNLPLPTTVLTPNRGLKMAISRWKSTQ